MEYIYAAMLLHKAGKQVTHDAVKKVLSAADIAVEEAKLKALVAALEGIDIEEAIKKASVVAAPVAAVEESKPAHKKEEKKEEETNKKSEESAAVGLGALFG